MKRTAVISVFLLNLFIEVSYCDDTNVLIIAKGDSRAGAVFFLDECLTRGLTNSISVIDLRKWATNTIQRYQRLETALAKSTAAAKQYHSVIAADVPNSIGTIQTRIPSCRSTKRVPEIDGWDDLLETYRKLGQFQKRRPRHACVRLVRIGSHPK